MKKRFLLTMLGSAIMVALTLSGTGLYAGEPTGYRYQQGSVLDSKTGKGVPGVPLALTAQYKVTTYWSTGTETTVDKFVGDYKLTDASGNYKSRGFIQTIRWTDYDPNGAPISIVERFYGFLSPVVQSTELTTTSSAGNTVYVRPKNIYNNSVDFPLTFINTELSFGFNNLNKFLHNVSSGYYTLVCAQPTVSLTAGTGGSNPTPGSVQFTFSLSGKYNNVSIGNATATISVGATTKEVNGGQALAIDWSLSNLTLTGFNNNSTHLTNVKNLINSQLEHTIYLAPAALSGTAFAIPAPVDVTVWNETSLSSVAITTSNISLKIETGWYVAKEIGVIDNSGGGTLPLE